MWRLPPGWDDEDRLAQAWRAARPFPHLVVDDVVPDAALPELLAILEEEPVERYEGDIFVFEVSTRSLHQVREVLDGLRISLAGWFYP